MTVRLVPPDDATPEAVLDERPTIEISTLLHVVVDQAIDALKYDLDVYQRDGELVRIVRVAETEADAAHLAGTPQIRRIVPATLTEHLTRNARWIRLDRRSGRMVETVPASAVVHAVAARGEYLGIRPIVGIAESPMLRPDGSIMQDAGYDGSTGYVYLPNAEFPRVADQPTQEDARYALDELADVFKDFPYRAEADRIVPIASILTLLARPAIRGSIAAIVLDATTRGSGKTLQADAISLIATGRPAGKMTWPTDEIELEKVLASYALRGAALILFDNITTRFGGGPLDKVLTARDRVELRVLGKSELPSLTWRALVLASGNNVEISGDTCRRVLVSRLEPTTETPETRTGFAHDPLLEWVTASRPRLVYAALTILRAWVVAGRPKLTKRQWGSFEEWTALVPQALMYAGATDPMGAKLQELADDPDRRIRAALIEGLARLSPDGVTVRSLVTLLYPEEHRLGDHAPDGYDDLREALEAITRTKPGHVPAVHALGNALRKHRGAVIAGRKLVSVVERNIATWRVVDLTSEGKPETPP
jgi:hypothetical protein